MLKKNKKRINNRKNLYLCKMRKWATYVFASLLTLVYGAGVIGVGVYDCHCSHNQQIVWLADDGCTCDHKHGHETGGRCCDVTYKVLQIDQNVATPLLLSNYSTVVDFAFIPVELMTMPATPVMADRYNHDPPPLILSASPDIYCLSQLRL